MSQGTAPKRSIDEIIGSIRSIMDRTEEERAQRAADRPNAPATVEARKSVANDDSIPDDLTDLPPVVNANDESMRDTTRARLAEPVAPQYVVDDPVSAFSIGGEYVAAGAPEDPVPPGVVVPSDEDAETLAEIAKVVSDNISEADASAAVSLEAGLEAELSREFVPHSGEAAAAPVTFGRRKTPARPAGGRSMADLDAEFGNIIEGHRGGSPKASQGGDAAAIAPEAAHGGLAALHDAVSRHAEVAAERAVEQSRLPVVQATPAAMAAHSADPVITDAMLRPVIREWLDDNLPPMVERLVREELSRAIGSRRD